MIDYYRYLFVKMKVFNYSELHFSEVTSYRIPLALSELPPTTDTQKGNSLHCMVENSTQSQIFRYGRSIFCLPHRPNFSNICDLCLHWVSVVRVSYYRSFFPFLLRSKLAQNVSPY